MAESNLTKHEYPVLRWCHHHLPGIVCAIIACVLIPIRILQIALYFCVLTPANFHEWYDSL